MRVLFIMNSGFDLPGPSNHLIESIIKEILEQDNSVHLIQKHISENKEFIPGTIKKFSAFSQNSLKIKQVKKNSFIKRYLVDAFYAVRCIKYFFKNRDVDVIFLQSCNTAFFHSLLLKLIINKPIVYNVQDIFPLNAKYSEIIKENTIYKILSSMQKSAYKLSNKIITISEDMKATLIKLGVNNEKIEVVYNWGYTDEYIDILDEENLFVKKHMIDNKKFKVVYAGNIGILQNVEILIDAAKLLKDNENIVFHIIGNGVQKENLLEKAQKYNLKNVRFFDMESSQLAPHIYSMADVNIIPLIKGVTEVALPSKTANCLATGKPIIGCLDKDSEFSKMLRRCSNCRVVDTYDSNELSNEIIGFYNLWLESDKIKNENNSRKLFKKSFQKSINSKKYVEILYKATNLNEDR